MIELLGSEWGETYHSSGWMDDFHLLKDGGTIIGNENLTLWVLDL